MQYSFNKERPSIAKKDLKMVFNRFVMISKDDETVAAVDDADDQQHGGFAKTLN